MKEILKDLLDIKQKLFDSQKFFTKSLDKRYPTLVNADSNKIEREVNDEIEFLLSSTLRIKSGRVVIKTAGFEYTEEVVLTRVPGLKRPYEPTTAFDLISMKSVLENGDMEREDPWDKKRREFVKASALKKSDMILQDRLKDFYIYLEKIIKWNKGLLDLISPSYGQKNIVPIKVKESEIKICSSYFSFLIHDPENKSKDSYTEIVSGEIIDYTEPGWSHTPILENQKSLLSVWKDFESFDKALLTAEKTKKELIKRGEIIFQDLKEYNKPVRLFNQLIKK